MSDARLSVGPDLSYLGPDLVAALSGLEVNNFSHDGSLVSLLSLLWLVWLVTKD